MLRNNFKYILILIVLSYCFLMLGNGILSLTNPDEVFYAQTAKEMVRYHSWLTPYLFDAPQFEKPIFLYWVLRIGFILFGKTNFSVRFFPALFGMLGVIAVYFLGLIGFRNEKKAFICSLILLSSGLYMGLSRTLFTDMIFSIFILFSLASFYWGYSRSNGKALGIILFFVFSALAVLTKGPLGFILPLSVVFLFLFIRKDTKFIFCKYSLWGFLIFLGVSLPWYVYMTAKYGPGFINEFFYNDHIRRLFEAEHLGNDKWYFYPASIVGCMFPWSLFTLVSLILLFKNIRKNANAFNIFLFSWIVIVFCVFEVAHSKLVSYIFPLFPALALITGDFIYGTALFENRNRVFFIISNVMAVILFLFPIAIMVLLPRFASYLPTLNYAYVFISSLIIFAGIFLFFVLKYKFFKAVFSLSFIVPIVLFFFYSIHEKIEPYISSQIASSYLLKNYNVGSQIICSKFFARGVRYYTDKEIAIIGIPESNFFSPHPVVFLGTDEKVKDYLRNKPLTYWVLRKSTIKDVERIAGKEYKFPILKQIGNEYILKVEYNKEG